MIERLQKIISASGLMSRRAAEKLIGEGRVCVNGIKAGIGDKADPETDSITIDGCPLSVQTEKQYYVLNKPAGYVTTMHDEKERKNVSFLMKGVKSRVYPVGRLDMYSEGLLIMTNDGELSNALMHPKTNIVKTYCVTVAYGALTNIRDAAAIMRKPIEIDGAITHPAKVEILSTDAENLEAELKVSISEGRNRQIRKLCENAGLRVRKLLRVSEGPIELGDLESGRWRKLTDTELVALRKAAGIG